MSYVVNYLVSAAIILFYLWHIAECSVCVCVVEKIVQDTGCHRPCNFFTK